MEWASVKITAKAILLVKMCIRDSPNIIHIAQSAQEKGSKWRFITVDLPHIIDNSKISAPLDGNMLYSGIVSSTEAPTPVSYTHLDVYKRQAQLCPSAIIAGVGNATAFNRFNTVSTQQRINSNLFEGHFCA